MNPRILVVGQSPGRKPSPLGPLGNASGRRIAKMAGVSEKEFLACDRVNLLTRFPGSCGKGEAFPAEEARRRAAAIRTGGRKVLVVGLAVAAAMGAKPEPLSITARETAEFWVMPHTSGIVLWWNDPSNVSRAEAFLRRFFRDERPGSAEEGLRREDAERGNVQKVSVPRHEPVPKPRRCVAGRSRQQVVQARPILEAASGRPSKKL